MSRSTEEWVGFDHDAPIPKRVKLRVWERCGGKCALTGKKLRPGDQYDIDHIVPLRDGGRHAEGNLQLVWRPAHREKTAAEAGDRAKTDRIRAKNAGLWPAPARKMQSRPFPKARKHPGDTP